MPLQYEFPVDCKTNFSRVLSSTDVGGSLWTAVQMERGRKTDIALYKNGHIKKVIKTGGLAYQPSISPISADSFSIVWNEARDKRWTIMFSLFEKEKMKEVDTVFESDRLLLSPSSVIFKDRFYCAWAGRAGRNIKISIAEKRGEKWVYKGDISKEGYDSFRPEISSDGKSIYCAYDSYRDKRYEVVCNIFGDNKWKELRAVPPAGERWLTPRILSTERGTYIVWVALKEVEDRRLGIRDHFPFAMVGRISDNKIEYLYDRTHPEDRRIVADLREGLLAEKTYQGYHGLRRNPYISFSDKGEIWCFWEVRKEKEMNHISGHLFGRKLQDSGTWSPYYDIYQGHYSYSVPKFFEEKNFRFSFIDFSGSSEKIISYQKTDLRGRRQVCRINTKKWKRWTPVGDKKIEHKRIEVKINDRKYKVFWGDTHCHSSFSPDAEGEVDELVNYAKDIAALDFVCIIDNDYYPHKSFTEVEWRVRQELSRHFTEKGRFISFAGWEFTYHDKKLSPSFNHRYVIYPFTQGALYRRIDRETDSVEKLAAKLKGKSVICCPHHCTYSIINPDVERNVEVVSSWRICMEEVDFTIKRLQEGKVFGFIGSSDSHRAVPGLGGALTGVVAEQLTPEGLYNGYRNRRLIATQGCRMKVDFSVSGLFIGQSGKVKDAPCIKAVVSAESKIGFVELVRDGATVLRKGGKGKRLQFGFVDTQVKKGSHFYFLRVKLAGDPSFNTKKLSKEMVPFSNSSRYPHNLARSIGVYAWTSPVWVKKDI